MFIATIYFVLQELNNRFNKGAVELLTLSSALNPINGYKMFDINDICKLANTFCRVTICSLNSNGIGYGPNKPNTINL